MAFNDAHLAIDTSAYFAEGVIASIQGMGAPAWEIRNAASLSFTALIMRVVGFRNLSTGVNATACIKSPTAAEFFSRYPSLHSFLLSQLKAAAGQLQTLNKCGHKSHDIHPSLFPVLVILSRLKPSVVMSTSVTRAHVDPAAFIPVVKAVSQSAVMGVRQLAATALAPLVPAQSLCNSCTAIAASLPDAQTPVPDHNALHGSLLQLESLLKALVTYSGQSGQIGASTADQSSSEATHACLLGSILSEVLAAMLRSSWLAGSSNKCLPVATAYLRAVKQVFLLAQLLQLDKAEQQQQQVSQLQPVAPAHFQGSSSRALEQQAKPWLQDLLQLHSFLSSAITDLITGTMASSSTSCPSSSALCASNDTASHVTGSHDHGASVDADSVSDACDPFKAVWLKECTALNFGPLLDFAMLLQQYAPPQLPTFVQSSADCSQDWAGSSSSDVCSSSRVDAMQQQVEGRVDIVLDRLLLALSSRSYDVRAAAVKGATHQLQLLMSNQHAANGIYSGQATQQQTAACLSDKVIEQLWAATMKETNNKVRKRLLMLLGAVADWQQQSTATVQQQQATACHPQVGVDAPVDRLQRVDQLQQLLTVTNDLTAKGQALQCLAQAIRAAVAAVVAVPSTDPTGTSAVAAATALVKPITKFLSHVGSAGQPSQPETMRAAAVAALEQCGLLQLLLPPHLALQTLQPGGTVCLTPPRQLGCDLHLAPLAKLAVPAWQLLLTLMEDEEDYVRRHAADSAQGVLIQLPQPPVQKQQQQAVAAETPAAHGSMYVEAVERAVFDLLASCSSWWPELTSTVFDLLTSFVFDSSAAIPKVLQHKQHRAIASPAQQNQQQLNPSQQLGVNTQQQHTNSSKQLQACHDQPSSMQRTANSNGMPQQGMAAMSSASSPMLNGGGVLTRRLFDKEADNHHEEPLLMAQLAAAALHKLLLQPSEPSSAQASGSKPHASSSSDATAPEASVGTCDDGTTQASTSSANAFDIADLQQTGVNAYDVTTSVMSWCHLLISHLGTMTARLTQASQSRGSWIGSMTSHPEVFVPLYRCLLGFWAVAPVLQAGRVQGGSGFSQQHVRTQFDDVAQKVAEAVATLKQTQPSHLLQPMLDVLASQYDVQGTNQPGSGKEDGCAAAATSTNRSSQLLCITGPLFLFNM